MKIRLKRDTHCAYDEHEITMYPREGFTPKPALPAGTVLKVDKKWMKMSIELPCDTKRPM